MGVHPGSKKQLLSDSLIDKVPFQKAFRGNLHKSWICLHLPHKFNLLSQETVTAKIFANIVTTRIRPKITRIIPFLYLQAHTLQKKVYSEHDTQNN